MTFKHGSVHAQLSALLHTDIHVHAMTQ